jgi:hypothetical protein
VVQKHDIWLHVAVENYDKIIINIVVLNRDISLMSRFWYTISIIILSRLWTTISIIIQDRFKKKIRLFLKTIRLFWLLSSFEIFLCFELKKKGWQTDITSFEKLLHPSLLIPKWKWKDITMNFVMRLPREKNNNNATWVIVDRLTKSALFLPKKMTDKLAKLYMIWAYVIQIMLIMN